MLRQDTDLSVNYEFVLATVSALRGCFETDVACCLMAVGAAVHH